MFVRGSDNAEGGSGDIDRPPAASTACSAGVPVPFIFGVPDLYYIAFEFQVDAAREGKHDAIKARQMTK